MLTVYYEKYINPLFIKLFIKGCQWITIVKSSYAELKENNEYFRIFVTELHYFISNVYSFMTSQKVEPRNLPWISTCWLVPDLSSIANKYTFIEDYTHFCPVDIYNDLFVTKEKEMSYLDMNYASKYFSTICSNFSLNQLLPLFIMKMTNNVGNPMYVVRRGDIYKLDPFTEKQSSVRFLSVEYTHPEMVSSIELKIDPEWFIVGNELFTPTFVLRVLEYQSTQYFFDTNYNMRIMDDECNIWEFGLDKYIFITETGYEIREVDTEKEEEEVDGVVVEGVIDIVVSNDKYMECKKND